LFAAAFPPGDFVDAGGIDQVEHAHVVAVAAVAVAADQDAQIGVGLARGDQGADEFIAGDRLFVQIDEPARRR
jgi:hypothetical protein